MAYSESQLEALERALASGALTVTFDGKSTTYRSVAELERAIAVVKRELGPEPGGGGSGNRFSLAGFRK